MLIDQRIQYYHNDNIPHMEMQGQCKVPYKICIGFLLESDKLTLKFKGLRVGKIILEKKSNVRGFTLSHLPYFEAGDISTQIQWYWNKNSLMGQWNKIKSL